jgi:cardiolipin synthase A/B
MSSHISGRARRTPGTALDFVQKSGLPRRVVVEAFIRLMRAGWVEIRLAKAGLEFHPTALGLVQAPLDRLPAATVTQPKKRSFAIEQVTGGVFRSRELDLRQSFRLPSATEDQLVVQLPGSLVPSQGDLSEVFTAIEGEDELIVGIDRSAERLLERHAVVMVRNGVIEGLPGRASLGLRNLILAKADEAVAAAQRSKEPKPASPAAVVDDVATPVSAGELVAPVQALCRHALI